MTGNWLRDDVDLVGRARELQIAPRGLEGTLRAFVPIWVVTVGTEVYMRTWYRRPNGWYGRVVESGRARIRVPGLEFDVAVHDCGDGPDDLRTAVDASYRAKYGSQGGADDMVTDSAAATTLRLTPDHEREPRSTDGP